MLRANYLTEEYDWINNSEDVACRRCLVDYARAFNTLNAEIIKPMLARDVIYNSQSVFEEMVGREKIMCYFRGKIETIRKGSQPVIAELASFPDGQSCVVMYQASSEFDGYWLDKPLAVMTIETNPVGKACAFLMITCAPSPKSARGTGIFPGREPPTSENPKRFIHESASFDEITLHVFYLDGEIGLDQSIRKTVEQARQ